MKDRFGHWHDESDPSLLRYSAEEMALREGARAGDAQGREHSRCPHCRRITWIEMAPREQYAHAVDYHLDGCLRESDEHAGARYCSECYPLVVGSVRCRCDRIWIHGVPSIRFHDGIHSPVRCSPRKPAGTACSCGKITATNNYDDEFPYVPWDDHGTIHDVDACCSAEEWLRERG